MLVSVLMPTYNVAPFVAEAIESILNQTYRDFELVIQDDGSSDGTPELVRNLAARDSRIVMLPPFTQNQGVIAARNSLLDHARGELIAWMDSDDRSAPDRLEKQVAFLKRHPDIGVVGTGIEYADSEMHPFKVERYSTDPARQAVDPEICCATVMARQQACANVRFRDAFRPGGEDGDWLLQIADRARITNIGDVLYTYRQHDSTSKAGAAAIRRLGVLARHAARARRQGAPDPVEMLRPDASLDYLSDETFLDHPDLSLDEKLTALSLPLPGRPALISVLIPYYNADAYLGACLKSLDAQTFRNFEVLIYDDGSDVPLRLERSADAVGDLSITIQNGVMNKGVAFARNKLLDMAQSPFIVWQDADDYARDIRLETLLRHLLEHADCKAVGSAINYVKGSVVTRSESYHPGAFEAGDFSGCCASFMLRRETVAEVGRFDLKFTKAAEDVDYLSRITPHAAVQNIDSILYYYRRHGNQLTERADWMDAQGFYYFEQVLRDSGLAPTSVEAPPEPEEMHALFEAALKLPRALKRSNFSQMYVRIKLRQVRRGQLSPLALIPLAAGMPIATFRAATGFVRHRGKLAAGLLRDRLLPRRMTPNRPVSGDETPPTAKPEALKDVIFVRCHDNWGDLEDALFHLTPGGRGEWDGVRFVRSIGFSPDWELVFNEPQSDFIDLDTSPNRLIFAIGEPPTRVHRHMHAGQIAGSLVLTTDPELAALPNPPRRYELTPTMTRAWSVKKTYDELRDSHVTQKPKALSWVTSNLALMQGHRYRLQFLDRLRAEVEFDLFGRGFNPIESKWDGLAPYRYSMAFENTRADYYFTEKLMDCFVAETMPIYYGSPIITQFFPEDAMVLIDPEDPEVIEKIRDVISSDLWEKRREAIREAKHLVLEKYNTFAVLARRIKADTTPALPREPVRIKRVLVDFGADRDTP